MIKVSVLCGFMMALFAFASCNSGEGAFTEKELSLINGADSIMRAVMLVCTLITAFVKGTSILTLAASILSIIAVYQEYNAHSELIADKDSRLSGNGIACLAGVLLLPFWLALALQ